MANVLTVVVPSAPQPSVVTVPGIQGPANVLTIGAVNSVDPSANATATITGTSPTQVLNLNLPRGRGIIAAGTTGQVLAKASNSDYDMVWQNANLHTHTVSQISDSTATGRSVLTATDAAAARSAIGAGTGSSNLAIGTTSTTAAAGNHTHSQAEAIVNHDGTAAGGTRPTGYFRVRWVGGTTRPTNMMTGDIWEHDV